MDFCQKSWNQSSAFFQLGKFHTRSFSLQKMTLKSWKICVSGLLPSHEISHRLFSSSGNFEHNLFSSRKWLKRVGEAVLVAFCSLPWNQPSAFFQLGKFRTRSFFLQKMTLKSRKLCLSGFCPLISMLSCIILSEVNNVSQSKVFWGREFKRS